ncbi:hypothetical protein [Serinicoccus marinus]|uniref:hypothetical protein n=1 Tax=Serinicoccus marinus TaxID=247333 RepID=UPI0024901F3F|nr:hypothetical protein [Serinicoccus marinus]
MSTRALWIVAGLCAVVGMALLYLVTDPAFWVQLLGIWLVVGPLGIALNLTLGRRRRERREDSPDSIEHQAAIAARSDTFEVSLILVLLLLLALVVAPGQLPWLWALLCLTVMLATFWVRYTVRLDRLRG